MPEFERHDRVHIVADSMHHGEWIGREGAVHKHPNSDQIAVLINGIGVRIFYNHEVRSAS